MQGRKIAAGGEITAGGDVVDRMFQVLDRCFLPKMDKPENQNDAGTDDSNISPGW